MRCFSFSKKEKSDGFHRRKAPQGVAKGDERARGCLCHEQSLSQPATFRRRRIAFLRISQARFQKCLLWAVAPRCKRPFRSFPPCYSVVLDRKSTRVPPRRPRATPPAHSRRLKRMLFSFLEKEKQRKRKIFFCTRPVRASVVYDSRFTQIRAKAGSPSDIRRCIPIPDVQATTLAARLFRSAFGAKRLCGIGSKCMVTD